MRALIILAVLACAAPAAAQDTFALTMQRDAALQAQADLARQREVELNNRLSTLESTVQTNQALSDIAAMRQRPAAPVYDPKALPAAAPKYASIPDDVLAASNARVRAAAANRR
ncbi:MAG: hypothetical protein JWQ29_2111 [Phenylobacterium sp.]|jgi:hypothetical protein|nr:hypothetical protein [Phenylobacterium sp.]